MSIKDVCETKKKTVCQHRVNERPLELKTKYSSDVTYRIKEKRCGEREETHTTRVRANLQ